MKPFKLIAEDHHGAVAVKGKQLGSGQERPQNGKGERTIGGDTLKRGGKGFPKEGEEGRERA